MWCVWCVHIHRQLYGRPERCSSGCSRAVPCSVAVAVRPPVPSSLLLRAPRDVVGARGRVVLIDQLLHNLP